MRYSILVIILLILTLLGIGLYNYYELHSQPNSLPEPALELNKQEKKINQPLTPEDLPDNLSVKNLIIEKPKQSYELIPQIDGEKGTLTLSDDLQGEGFMTIINPQTERTESLEFTVTEGILNALKNTFKEGSRIIPGEGLYCINAVTVDDINFSRCFALKEKINQFLDNHEDQNRSNYETSLMNDPQFELSEQDRIYQDAALQENFEEVSYNFEDS